MQEDFLDEPPAYADAAAFHHPEEWVDASPGASQLTQAMIYSRSDVYVHPSSDRMERIGGTLSLLEDADESLVLTWAPNLMSGERDASAHARARMSRTYAIQVSFRDIVSIHKTEPKLGYTYPNISITVRLGATFPPFYFHNGGLREFINMVAQYVRLTQAPGNPQLLLVNDVSTHLSRTLSELHVSTPGVIAVSSHTDIVSTASEAAAAPPASAVSATTAPPTWPSRAVVGSPGRDAQWSLLERFARVTQIARETTAQILENNSPTQRTRRQLRPLPESPPPAPAATAQPAATTAPQLPQPQQPRDASVIPAVAAEAAADVDPLTAPIWFSLFDEEGRLSAAGAHEVRRRAFYGGVENDIRPTVWKFLLGVYPWDSTEIERNLIDDKCAEDYGVLLTQWSSILPAQEANFSKFRERKHLIEKDVARTDRRQPFYAEEDGPNCRTLREMLITYTFYDFDIGYVQGMSDLLAPIYAVMQEKTAAFWCFVNLMKRMRGNFHKDQHGMNGHLALLRALLRVVDPQLMAYLETHDATNMYFCYRWMLIDYKREFSFFQVMRLWEAIWSNCLTTALGAFIAMAILRAHRDVIMESEMEFDDILKYINDLAQTMDVEQVLQDARTVYRDVQQQTHLPPEVAALLGNSSGQ